MYGSRAMTDEVPVRERYSRSLTEGLTPESASALCSAGVDWLWVEGSSKEKTTAVAFANESVIIYRLENSQCTG